MPDTELPDNSSIAEEAVAVSQALVPQRQHMVSFYGDFIPVAQAEDGVIYVPIRPLTEFLGLAFGSQRNRIQRDTVLAEAAQPVVMARSDGRRVPMLCLPLPLLPGWLFGVQVGRSRPDLADKLNRYRKECFLVLWEAFKGDILPQSPLPSLPTEPLSGAEVALEIAAAVHSLARHQVEIEARVNELAGRHTVMADYMRGFVQETRQRITTLEVQVNGEATITEEQAAEIAMAVKSVGQRLEARGDKAGYQRVYGELYRRYNIGAYKRLPLRRFHEVSEWLASWYRELEDTQGTAEEPLV